MNEEIKLNRNRDVKINNMVCMNNSDCVNMDCEKGEKRVCISPCRQSQYNNGYYDCGKDTGCKKIYNSLEKYKCPNNKIYNKQCKCRKQGSIVIKPENMIEIDYDGDGDSDLLINKDFFKNAASVELVDIDKDDDIDVIINSNTRPEYTRPEYPCIDTINEIKDFCQNKDQAEACKSSLIKAFNEGKNTYCTGYTTNCFTEYESDKITDYCATLTPDRIELCIEATRNGCFCGEDGGCPYNP